MACGAAVVGCPAAGSGPAPRRRGSSGPWLGISWAASVSPCPKPRRAGPGRSRRHPPRCRRAAGPCRRSGDRKSTRLNSSHVEISYAVFCLKKKKKKYLFCLNEKKKTKTSNEDDRAQED